MMRVAEMNQGARQGHLQLVSEAHVLLRTWLHRLTWLQVRELFIFILIQMFFWGLGGGGGGPGIARFSYQREVTKSL